MNIQKAYEYYISNIDKSCNKNKLSFEQFIELFPSWLTKLQTDEFFNPGIEEIIEIGICGKGRFISLKKVLEKYQ